VRGAAAEGLPPGKTLQILAIANCHVFHGESRRRVAADQLYPLLAQPVVELALGIGVPELAGAAFDRPFARRAFEDRLPPSVVRRRAKGRLSVYFGHLVAASAEGLREYLLEGCLADAGLLDRQAVARILDPDQLVSAGRPAEVLRVAATEAWVRYWQTRAADTLSTQNRMG
jgi:asparagine synthase (glutamine-hydrolysing)